MPKINKIKLHFREKAKRMQEIVRNKKRELAEGRCSTERGIHSVWKNSRSKEGNPSSSDMDEQACYQLSEEQLEKLIGLIKGEEVLWKGESPVFGDQSEGACAQIAGARERVAAAMGLPGLGAEEVAQLINTYVRFFNKAAALPPTYKQYSFWYKKMNFLLKAKGRVEMDSSEAGTENAGDSDESEEFILQVKEELPSDEESAVDRLALDPTSMQADTSAAVQNMLPAYNIIIEPFPSHQPAAALVKETNSDFYVHVPRQNETELIPDVKIKPTRPKKYLKAVKTNELIENVEATIPENPPPGRQLRKRPEPNRAEFDDMIKKKLIGMSKSQDKILNLLKAKPEEAEDMFDKFAKYVSSSLRNMGTYEALALQPKIVQLISSHQAQKQQLRDKVAAQQPPNNGTT